MVPVSVAIGLNARGYCIKQSNPMEAVDQVTAKLEKTTMRPKKPNKSNQRRKRAFAQTSSDEGHHHTNIFQNQVQQLGLQHPAIPESESAQWSAGDGSRHPATCASHSDRADPSSRRGRFTDHHCHSVSSTRGGAASVEPAQPVDAEDDKQLVKVRYQRSDVRHHQGSQEEVLIYQVGPRDSS